MARPDGHKEPDYLAQVIREAGITMLHFVPSMLDLFVEHRATRDFPQLRRVLCSGEALPPRPATAFRTATAGDRAAQPLRPDRSGHRRHRLAVPPKRPGLKACRSAGRLPISRCMCSTPWGRSEPLGVAGELHIGGIGVARGYLNQPELTAERFIADPFSSDPQARLYKTGDLGRWLANGALEYLGRNDFQVKIRGLRIEIGEVEARPGPVRRGSRSGGDCPRRRPEPAGKQASGRLSVRLNRHRAEQLRVELLKHLPEYMVPSAFVHLDSLPLSPNGKLDRKALPAPDLEAVISHDYEAPQGDIEIALAQLWQEMLGLSQVGRHDQFFELGGHSLLAARLISQIRQQLGVEVGLVQLFAHPELKALAQVIAQAGRSTLPEILPVTRDQAWPLSFGQQRLWFLAQMEGASAAYHMPGGLSLRGNLDREALQRALERIVARHEGLRTTFTLGDDEQPLQRIAAADTGFSLQLHDLQGQADAEAKLQALAGEEALQAFDLEQGPLIRGRLIRMAEDHHVLLVTMHHIVSDGWSITVLTRELAALYEAFSQGQDDPLAPLALQYLGLRRVAASLAQWRVVATAMQLLAAGPGGGAGTADVADRPGASGTTGLCRCHAAGELSTKT